MSLLEQARQAGLTVTADGDRLVVHGPKEAAALAEELLDHKDEVMPLVAEAWNERIAAAWLASTLHRVGKLHDELAPDIPVDALDTPEWNRAEAIVHAAYSLKSRVALRDALDEYERFARAAFEGLAT